VVPLLLVLSTAIVAFAPQIALVFSTDPEVLRTKKEEAF